MSLGFFSSRERKQKLSRDPQTIKLALCSSTHGGVFIPKLPTGGQPIARHGELGDDDEDPEESVLGPSARVEVSKSMDGGRVQVPC